MRLALDKAQAGRGHVEPNPMVGAVLVRDGVVVGIGQHERYGGPHAEVMALAQAGDAARGSTLYVTLEPCCHHGKTPPCTDAIVRARVASVKAAIRDPAPWVSGGGLAMLRAAGIDVAVGLEATAAAKLNAPFLKRVVTSLPYVTAKWAMTLDGKTAVASGDSRWISSAGARARVHELRGRMDAILVGIETALADDPLLTARPPGPRTAVRVVLDSRAVLPLESQLARTARETPVLVAVTDRAPADRREALAGQGCEIIAFPGSGRVPILPLLAELGRRSMTNLLIEGGGRVLGAFFDAGQVDEVVAYVAPLLEAGDHARTAARGRGVSRMAQAVRLQDTLHYEIEGDLCIEGVVPQAWRSVMESISREPTPDS
jgi:diaminohydroxyphosphoribosylaminopyrimidine deaminase/5-amino-6-(5-phosphoribosylamino)uracil reductase